MLKEYLKEKKELVEKTIDSYLGEFDYPYAVSYTHLTLPTT